MVATADTVNIEPYSQNILKLFLSATSKSFDSKLGLNVPLLTVYVFVSIRIPRWSPN
jgi:hypothetical protein